MTEDAIAQAVARARDLLASRQPERADALLVAALADAPGHPELLYLRGVAANRRGAHDEAVEHLQAALAGAPSHTMALLALGHAWARRGQWQEAVAAYEAATRQQPDWADAFFNLGLARRKLDDPRGACAAFLRAWRLAPEFREAAAGCVATLAAWVRSGAPLPAPQRCGMDASPTISVVVCSIDDGKAARITELYHRLLAGLRHDVLVLRDARSLAEAYNRGVAATRGDVVILSHDDIDIAANDFAARLVAHLRSCDALGPIGATRMTGPVPIWAGHPHLRGWITHHPPGAKEWQVDLLHPLPLAGGVVILDGVLLAGRRDVFATVPFDADTFDGFHGYDVDWSYRAAQAGFRMAAAGDLRVIHASGGRYDATWERYAQRFCAKHAVAITPAAEPPFRTVTFDSAQQVGAFYDGLASMAEADLADHPEVAGGVASPGGRS